MIKSPAEQNLMRTAGQISAEAINRAIQVTKPGFTEHQLFATVDYESRMRGAETLAYVPVVATGTNANIIHYIDNKQILGDGELVLMDAGINIHPEHQYTFLCTYTSNYNFLCKDVNIMDTAAILHELGLSMVNSVNINVFYMRSF